MLKAVLFYFNLQKNIQLGFLILKKAFFYKSEKILAPTTGKKYDINHIVKPSCIFLSRIKK